MLRFIFTLLSGLYLIHRMMCETKINGNISTFSNHQLFDNIVKCTTQESTDCSSSLNENHFLTSHTDVLVEDIIKCDKIREMTIIAAQKMSMDEFSLMMYNVSDPSSLDYGQHWTKNEVEELISSKEVRYAVVSYLILHSELIVSKTMDDEDQEMESHFVIALWGRAFNADFYLQDIGESDDDTTDDYIPNSPLSASRSKMPTGIPASVPSEPVSEKSIVPIASSVPTHVSSEPKSWISDNFLRSTPISSTPTVPEYPSSHETFETTFETSLSPSSATNSSTSPSIRSFPPSLDSTSHPSLPLSVSPTLLPPSEMIKPHHFISEIPTPVPGNPTMNPTASYVSILKASQVRSRNISP